VAMIGGQSLKGSDFLWAAYLRWLGDDPAGLSPARQADVTMESFSGRMRADDGSDPHPASAAAAGLAAAYGESIAGLGTTPDDLVAWCATSARPMQSLLAVLDHVGGYREDPLRKKSALLGVILRQRPEAWLPDVPGDDAPPIVDYHVQRTCLRTGMVDVVDDELRDRLVDRAVLDQADEEAVRRASYSAVAELVRRSGRSMGTVDWFLFSMRRRCPETQVPDCSRCPAEPACAQRTELFQPVRRTTFY